MLGVAFDLLEQVVSAADGDDAWDDLLERAGTDGVFTVLGDYDVGTFVALIAEVPGTQGMSRDAQLRSLGEQFAPGLARRYARHFAAYTGTASLFAAANYLLRAEAGRYRGVPWAPHLDVHWNSQTPHLVALGFRSPAGVCALVEGLVVGVAREYGEVAHVVQPKCVAKGAPSCFVVCEMSSPPVGVRGVS